MPIPRLPRPPGTSISAASTQLRLSRQASCYYGPRASSGFVTTAQYAPPERLSTPTQITGGDVHRGAVDFEAARNGSLQIRPWFPVSHSSPATGPGNSGGGGVYRGLFIAAAIWLIQSRFSGDVTMCNTNMPFRGIHIEPQSSVGFYPGSQTKRSNLSHELPSRHEDYVLGNSPRLYSLASLE